MNVIRRLLLVINLFICSVVFFVGIFEKGIFSSITIGALVAWYVIYQAIFYITTGKLNRDFLIDLMIRD